MPVYQNMCIETFNSQTCTSSSATYVASETIELKLAEPELTHTVALIFNKNVAAVVADFKINYEDGKK